MESSTEASAIVTFVFLMHVCRLSTACSMLLILYDSLLTFSQELDLVWYSPWTAPKIVYYVNRYSSIVFAIVYLIAVLGPHKTAASCLFMYQLQTWYGWASIAIVQLIIQLWLYTIYNWNRRFVAFISAIYVVFVISTAITYGITMSRLRVLTTNPFCIVVDMSVGDSFIATAIVELATATLPPYLLATTLPWLGFTLLMLSLLAYRTIKSYRTRQSHDLAFILIRDTMVYCVVIFVVDLLDVLVVTLASSTLVPASSGLVIALPSILGSRMLLNLRQVDRKRELRLAVDGIDVDQWETILDI